MDINLLLEGLKTLVNSVADIKQREIVIAAQKLILELQSQLLEAQKAANAQLKEGLALVRENQTLREEVSRLREEAADRERYELLAPAPGVLVYAPKPSRRGVEPPHWLCQNCRDKGVKAMLQDIEGTWEDRARRFVTLVCPECRQETFVPREAFAKFFLS